MLAFVNHLRNDCTMDCLKLQPQYFLFIVDNRSLGVEEVSAQNPVDSGFSLFFKSAVNAVHVNEHKF